MEESDLKKLIPGRIVWSRIPDMQGRGEYKLRPCLLLTPPTDVGSKRIIKIVGGSTIPPTETNLPFTIRVNGSRDMHGSPNPKTGLPEQTWFYAFWILTIQTSQIDSLAKFCPSFEYVKLLELIKQISQQ